MVKVEVTCCPGLTVKFAGEMLKWTPLAVSFSDPRYMLNETVKDTLTGDDKVKGIVPPPPGGSTTMGELFSPATINEEPKPWDTFNSTLDRTGHSIGVIGGVGVCELGKKAKS